MKKLIGVIALILTTVGLFSQENYLNDISQTQELSKKVAKLFSEKKISDAFNELIPYWPIPSNEIDVLQEKTIKYLNIIENRFGNSEGTLKVKNETISDIAIRETYLIKYELSALRLIFTYYKNDSGWIVNAFKWDDSFTDEFK